MFGLLRCSRPGFFAPVRLAIICSAIAGLPAFAEYKLNFQDPVTEVARQQYELHLLILYVIIAIGVGVFGVMIYSIIKHRKSAGHQAATFHHHTGAEVAWTVVPAIIIILMAFPATKVIINAKNTDNSQMTIKVIGYQWKWGYDYLDDNIFFYSTITTPPEQIGPLYYGASGTPGDVERPERTYLLEVDNEMVVPVGVKVRLLLTAADVIHSWWVPSIGVKQDAVPGLVREAWFKVEKEGVYRGQCTELCGKNHGFMPIVVRAVSVDEYAEWVANRGGGAVAADGPVPVGDVAAAAPVAEGPAVPEDWSMENVMAFGEQTYVTHCSACHQVNGQGLGDAFPALVGSPVTTGPIEDQISLILNGVQGTTMASFANLSDAELAAVITYERNAWGGDSGDLVTAEEIGSQR